jgi:hypothetical protein
VYIANARWERHWANRATYVHHYDNFDRWEGTRGEEQHELIRRN